MSNKRFYGAVKGKVIIGFVVACFALLAAWGISKFVFSKMLNTVEEISKPNDRLRIVNGLFHRIASLDQLQRDEVFNKQGNYGFFKESKKLRISLDSLYILYDDNKEQRARIKFIKTLVIERDKQFTEYLKVRESLVSTKSFSDEVEKLNELVGKRSRQVDSAVLTTETTTNTTTVGSNDEEKSRSFLSRLFGKKKADVYKIINEEFKIKRDTLNAKAEDSLVKSMEVALKTIEREQKQKSQSFLNREAELSSASNNLTNQMLQILHEVEADAVAQVDVNGIQAKVVVNDGIDQITSIIIAFFLLTVILLYLILTDITKSNRYRKELEQAKDDAEYHSQAKQRFLSNMSHEIRTPLQSILGYSEIIAKEDHPNKKSINAIYQSSIHLLQIVNEVLDYNRIISGEFKFNTQIFNINDLLLEVEHVMQPLAEQKQLQLITSLNLGDITFVKGDAFRLKQILFNLLGNAIKFTLKGEISLIATCKKEGKYVHFNCRVKDTGIGFANDDNERIFKEFEQIDSPQKNIINSTGTGLGLTIVKSLVENQNGRIYVESKPGVGTTFNIYLKYEYIKAPENYESKRFTALPTGKVWVIDDDKLILELCGLIFRGKNIPHKIFNHVSDILNEQPDQDLKYVLIDMRMPEMTGLELCRILKRKLPATVKFFAITAQVLPEEREMVLSDGFDGLILKPFRSDDLLSIFEKNEIMEIQPELNLNAIKKMTFGDQKMLEKIMDRFELDSKEDTVALLESLAKNDRDNSRLIVHRLAGRVAQMGAKTLAGDFRYLEMEIAEKGITTEIEQQIFTRLATLDELLVFISKMDYSMA